VPIAGGAVEHRGYGVVDHPVAHDAAVERAGDGYRSLGYGASLLFFGFCCILFGHLIQKSGYLPRAIGIALALAGYGYAAFSIAQILSPSFAARVLFPWIIPIAFVAESALALWLLVRGVNSQKWNEMT
jgi:hypothetical protein